MYRPTGYRSSNSDYGQGPNYSVASAISTFNKQSHATQETDSTKPVSSSPGCKTTKSKRPTHLQKGKTAKDKRKMREKRRSTGVVNLPSESTGDSLDDDEDKANWDETKRNTSYNEVIDADNPETPAEENHPPRYRLRVARIDKSPSDLDADFEDNQDYDSTISQSESSHNLSVQSESNGIRYTDQSQRSTAGIRKEQLHSVSSTRNQPIVQNNISRLSTAFLEQGQDNKSKLISPKPFSANRFDRDRTGLAKLSYRVQSIDIDDKPRTPSTREVQLEAKNIELEKQLKKEREECRRLRSENMDLNQLVGDRDAKIARLMADINLLNQDLDAIDEENEKLHGENRALVHAMSSLGADL